jgi:WD40 repeat protein
MHASNDPFFPHRVDESVEQFASTNPFDNVADAQPSMDVNERLVHDMQQLYSFERKRYQRALQRVEERLVAHYTTSSQMRSVPSRMSGGEARRAPEQIRQGRFYQMEKRQRSKFGRQVGLLVAAMVMLVLVGSMLLVLNATRQRAAQPSGTTLGSSTGAHFGQTIYTTPGSSAGFQELSWSPDSKRIASLTDSVQIWDATTGAHRVTVHLPSGSWPYALAWAPNSQLIAIGTSKSLILADGQSGAILHTFAVNTNTGAANSGSNSYLSTLSPLSGGVGVRAVAWSPDGHSLAISISHGATGSLEVVNAQTGAQDYTLPVTGNYVVGALAWSSDSKYLAGHVFNTQPGAQTVPADQLQMIWAWNVSTRQVIFKQTGGNGTGDPLAWQPGSDNLAFLIWVPGKGGNTISAIGLWNVATNTLVKQYAAAAFGPLAWSPDGKYLAYGEAKGQSTTNSVGILDAGSGEQVYTYKQMHANIGTLAWSPDGKYIVSGEGASVGNMVAKVWTAE